MAYRVKSLDNEQPDESRLTVLPEPSNAITNEILLDTPKIGISKPLCTISRYSISCGVCAAMIVPGDSMFPLSNNNQGNGLSWVHEACHTLFPLGVPPPPTCRHWTRLGRCPTYEAGMCAFRHDEKDRGTTKSKRKWGGKRTLVRNSHKNTAFRIFLMKTYGLDFLQSGVVLDVAGGKGELSWELQNLTGVESVVVDPRPVALSAIERKWTQGMFEPKRFGPVFAKWYPACKEGCSKRKPRRPSHLRCFFEAEKFLAMANDDDRYDTTEKWFQGERSRAKAIKWTTKGLQKEGQNEDHHEDDIISEVGEEEIDNEVADSTAAISILKRCKLVIGLHPDQAAGDIAEFANDLGVPWCIVPCCVYSDMFPKRRLQDGSQVKSHSQLLQWFSEVYPESKVATLDIEGKNQVVYTTIPSA
mmetsp:Transcript_23506/g.32972  ORF Transcript_23506/g.32972 Transcript_23506/m.32972 type:complete len:416 (-) Transcript_23506:77-1324(-)